MKTEDGERCPAHTPFTGGGSTTHRDEHFHRVGWAGWAVSGLNGLFGDLLRDRQNGLALEMAFYEGGRPIPLRSGLERMRRPPQPRICLLVHGLGCNEGIWAIRDSDRVDVDTYGTLLEADLGYTPFYVRYNTGLSIAENGKCLVSLVADLVDAYPTEIEEIVMIGHSMGGLVLRSACHYGVQHASRWVEQVTRVFYLGTPHDGADLERFASTMSEVLQMVSNPITRILGDVLDLRSQGVKDLKFGTLLEPDVMDDLPEGTPTHHRKAVPWLSHAQHYLIGGTLTDDPGHAASWVFGDGLVGIVPASGKRKTASGACGLPVENTRVFPGVHHIELARSRQVYEQIRVWCEGEVG